MPLFSTKRPIAPAAVVVQWATLFPGQPRLTSSGAKKGVVTFSAGHREVMAIQIPLPVPKQEALAAVSTSWMWQRPDDPVSTHVAHAIVTALGADDPVQSAWDVARVSAAMLHAGSGVALYWGSSRQVHVPGIVTDFAAEEGSPPVCLWVGITLSAESLAGPFSAATHGLEALGHKEFEVLASTKGIGALRATLLDVAGYVLAAGPVLLDGQTFGPTANDRWTVRHTKGELVPGRDVIVLGIP